MELIENATKQKLRGGFYTPRPIVDFILKWAFNGNKNQDILEPSCGNGIFLEQIKKNNHKYQSITAIELDKIEAQKTDNIPLENKTVINTEFHSYCSSTNKRFDIIVGNPPYIRYQYFDKQQQIEAGKIFDRAGLKYSKLTNAWVSFVVGSSLLLKNEGKIGFVLPAELLQVSYAKPLREFSAHFYNKINIISFRKLIFPDIQQEVILLLCEKNKNKNHSIEHLELESTKGLKTLNVTLLKSSKKKIDFKSNKWTFYFLDQKEIDFLEELNHSSKISKIGDFANVEVGITTGANEFFTVQLSTVEAFDLQEYAKPLVGRSVQVSSLRFNDEDWLANRNSEARAHLLVFPPLTEIQHNKSALKYLKIGKSKNIHKGYKCSIRKEWQRIPSIKVSEALFVRRNNLYPKLVTNEVRAYTTDTMHRVFVRNDVCIKAFVVSFYNSLSFAFSEILGRSYGGGVLELMPSEVEKILLPYRIENADHIDVMDTFIRGKKSTADILAYTNKTILKDGYGFSDKDIKLADNIWKKLRKRRLNRRK